MRVLADRDQVHFRSGETTCAAWHYRGHNGACLIMAAGGVVPKEPGTDPFAKPFHAAGFSVLAFDYRRLGQSGGRPRQIIRIREQQADWQAAIAFAATLPEVDAAKLVIWGYSLSGGHVLAIAARNPHLAAAIAHAPVADGVAASLHAMRYQSPLAAMRLTGRGVLDAIGGLFGRKPLLVPLAAKPGTVAMLTTPDALDADRAFSSDNHPSDWQKDIAARSALRIGRYRPGRQARRIQCPLLVIAHDDDRSALPKPGVRAAQRAANGTAVHLRGGHYGGYLESHEEAVAIQLSFVAHHIGRPDRPHDEIHWQREVPESMRSHDTLAGPDYTDLFTGTTTQAGTRSAEQWARAIFENAPAGLRVLIPAVHRLLLGLRVDLRRSPGHVLGWKIADPSDNFVRLENHSRLITPHLVLALDEDRVSIATFIRYNHPIAPHVWRAISVLHRRVGIALLSRALSG